jgi:hypothetical protein
MSATKNGTLEFIRQPQVEIRDPVAQFDECSQVVCEEITGSYEGGESDVAAETSAGGSVTAGSIGCAGREGAPGPDDGIVPFLAIGVSITVAGGILIAFKTEISSQADDAGTRLPSCKPQPEHNQEGNYNRRWDIQEYRSPRADICIFA